MLSITQYHSEKINESESNAIVVIRATAMFSIILCHLFQAYDNYLASVFNIGVQVFLVMSGYLYGKKDITNWSGWYKKRFMKLYIPYIIVTAAVFTMHLIFSTQAIKWYHVLVYLTNLQGLRSVFNIQSLNVLGLSHLWFMTAIMFAYFSTPLLQFLRKYSLHCLILILILVLPAYKYLPTRILFGLEWFWLYAFGYFFANLNFKYRIICICLFSICYLIIATRINGLLDLSIWLRTGRCHHCILGILLFTSGVTFIRCLSNTSKIMNIFRWFDKYSYHIFAAHFVVMIGSFSLARITDYTFVNILVMMIAAAFLTFLLVKATKLVNQIINYNT